MPVLTAPFRLSTRSGLVLDVRPVDEADEPVLAALFDRVSAEDRRFRFLHASEHVGHAELDPLVHPDHFRTESWLATDAATGEAVATALLACDNALDTAEVAVSIGADHRGKGVGWALLDLLAEQARKRGVRRVISIEDRANHAAIELEREKGFVPEAFDGDPTLVILAKHFR
ncbi:MAG: GNAT family N-acetyltransferase [Sphingomonadales bacterium]|nr:GNAT family N-acetyltransferase [Sphingomonadales bacterium]